MAKRKKKGNPIIVGLVLFGAALSALWKNEHRFDYYKAATKTVPVEETENLLRDDLFSHTGKMDQNLTLEGYYVDSFQGYLNIQRSAKIYAWDRDENDEGVKWSKKWMSSLERNDRNKGLQQKLTSDYIHPKMYEVGDVEVPSDKIQFIDSSKQILSSSLQLTTQGTEQNLVVADAYFYLSKGGSLGSEELGDERLSYRGLPVPETATYFGKWSGEHAVAHQVEINKGIVSSIIGDKGILHHLVAGSRETALLSIKAHLRLLKNIVRGVGLTLAAIGGGIFFSSLTRFLVFIPVIGTAINRISGWLGILIGFILGLITLVLAFLTNQPVILALLLIALGSAFFFLWKNAKQKRERVQSHLKESLGHFPSQDELEEMEYVKLYQLAASDGTITPSEQKELDRWTKRQGWSAEQVSSLTQRAKEDLSDKSPRQNLESLIRLALADGQLSRSEMKNIEHSATKIGIGRLELSSLIGQAQRA